MWDKCGTISHGVKNVGKENVAQYYRGEKCGIQK